MDDFDRGYPKPADFEDASPGWFAAVTGRRIGALAVIVLLAGLLGGAVEFGPQIMDALSNKMQPLMGDARQTMAIRIVRNIHAGNLDKALADSDRLVEIAPELGHLLRGDVLGRQKRYKESIADYNKVIEIDPSNHMAYNNRAWNRALGRFELKEAMVDAEKAVDIAGNVPAYLDTRGYLYYLHGKHELALADLNQVLDDLSKFEGEESSEGVLGEIFFHRGLVHKAMGNEEMASADFLIAKKQGFVITEYPQPVFVKDAAAP